MSCTNLGEGLVSSNARVLCCIDGITSHSSGEESVKASCEDTRHTFAHKWRRGVIEEVSNVLRKINVTPEVDIDLSDIKLYTAFVLILKRLGRSCYQRWNRDSRIEAKKMPV